MSALSIIALAVSVMAAVNVAFVGLLLVLAVRDRVSGPVRGTGR